MRKVAFWLTMVLVLAAVAACGGAPEQVEVTRVVTETVVEEGQTVEVTRVIEVQVEVPMEEAAEPVEATGTSDGGSPHTPDDGPKAPATSGWVDESGVPAEGVSARGEGEDMAEAAMVAPSMADSATESVAAPSEPLPMSTASPTMVASDGVSVPQNLQLTAGTVDDNANWDEYQTYLRQYSGPAALSVDVSERHQITVLDPAGRPVLGAALRIIGANGEVVQTIRTPSNGRAYFFPRALPAAQQTAVYTIRAEFGGQTSELALASGGSNNLWTIAHPVGNADTAETKLDILFLIDATGSMADEIYQLTANVQAIARRISELPSAPNVRFGMTVYRDRGDEFTTRTFEFTPDIAFFEEGLRQVEANGGGDYPEDLNEGLFKAVHVPEWRVEETVSLIFLIADAPPHLDYADQETNYALEMVEAAERGIKIYPIASSDTDQQAEYIFRQMAQYTGGKFLFLTYGAGGAGTTGGETTMTVDESDFDPTSLDGLVVQMVEEELAHRVR